MSLPANQAVPPPPSQPSTLSYGVTARIDATNSYPNGFAINLATTPVGAYLATVPSAVIQPENLVTILTSTSVVPA